MTPWLLIIALGGGEAPAESAVAGVLATEGLCEIAGAAIVQALRDADPAQQVGWMCLAQAPGAPA